MIVRNATQEDASGISAVLCQIVRAGNADRPCDPDSIRSFYIDHPDQIETSVAVDNAGVITGFQSLKIAVAGNPYDVAIGWGVIGTYVSPTAKRSGTGSALFAATVQAAKRAGITDIDATIGKINKPAQGYYDAMGFKTYQTRTTAICKRFTIR